jgi:hypothetical protein
MRDVSLLEVRGMQAHAIIAELQDLFPPTNPTPSDDIATIMYRAGQRSVVEWLQDKLKE